MLERSDDSPNGEVLAKPSKSGGVSFIIHGHTHRPAEHEFVVDGNRIKRKVLGDWGEKWSYLEWSENSKYELNF